ncbi:MAG: tRNA uridine-5-carboxymethylaminomethyl(34) synthesis enzyme MnmG [Candidatus Lambdaproteobacteria bacterium RIFOXYD2_FULL_50_16]|uniref:tRNA uridine 5-carboxymethylaminomethyl modification enzyme MnmG n=1 Tax=Candidatus Lambdaproteobacteria bacterium RIFOXYD2_FULL_50_16 TaxID=1817772 RepID=A0A1F6GFT8_9PROT|nr:MAG: tRNA uridine-5-carboxymethylaminomethyl(34) synthesis enzyme MnmG [Candidatus Lambdaproteobacteria bacterium RIFOXYD2_FULL_50_16]
MPASSISNPTWGVIVVGGGHAGAEAALAAAKLGVKTLLLTQTVDNLGAMSCNPAIGGLAKGHLVKEIDALGGAMGQVADQTAIQFRVLNRAKGAAVQATRCQSDMLAYKTQMRARLERQPGLTIKQAEVAGLKLEMGRVVGVTSLMGEEIKAQTVVLTTGTFLNGLIHIGDQRHKAGRAWEFPSTLLAEQLKALGLNWGRLKTGTTPRLDGRTIDFSKMEPQPGDDPFVPFSFWGPPAQYLAQQPCHITFTNAKGKEIIEANIHLSAMYSGAITGIGPRYCPSIEDKVSRFPERDRHQIFIEPTSLASFEYYPNGMSTSLPLPVQEAFMRSIVGLEQVEIVRPGYAIEYDYLQPTGLKNSLESKDLPGLFAAGQVNGTSGYEEAAAQGLIAGINAARLTQNRPPLVLGRHQAYIGVLIDDLVSKGTAEPYRMFTSRAEYRLSLREDNADLRLSPIGREIGLLGDKEWDLFNTKQEALARLRELAHTLYVYPEPGAPPIEHRLKLEVFLKKPELDFAALERFKGQEELAPLAEFTDAVKKTVETEFKYEGYLRRQESQVQNYLKTDAIQIPASFDYTTVIGLSKEVCQKLLQARPQTLGQAAKISGITPAAIALLMVAIQKGRK